MTLCPRTGLGRNHEWKSICVQFRSQRRWNSLLSHRENERAVNVLYQKLTQHGQHTVRIQPRIEYAPLYLKVLNSGLSYRIDDSVLVKRSREKLLVLLESVTFHVFCVLECLKNGKEVHQIHVGFFERVIERLGSDSMGAETSPISDAKLLAESFCVPSSPILVEAIRCFHKVTESLRQFQGVQCITSWIQILASPSLTAALVQEADQELPAFVVHDIMNRTPLYREEFIAQFDLWMANTAYIAAQKWDQISAVKASIRSLVRHSVMFEPSCLLPLVTNIDQAFKFKSHGSNSKLSALFLGELMWDIASLSFKHQHVSWLVLADAQKYLMSLVPVKKDGHKDLSLKGYLGIAVVMSRVSQDKASQIFKVAERRYPGHARSKKEQVAFDVACIWLARDAESAVNCFKEGVETNQESCKLWIAMVQKLRALGAMNEERARILFQRFAESNAKVAGDFITELIRPVRSMALFEEMQQRLSTPLGPPKKHLFVGKYLQLLSDQSASGSHCHAPSNGNSEPHEHMAHLFAQCPEKSIHLTSAYLRALLSVAPQSVFDVYRKEVLEPGHLPNATCLEVLLELAIKYDRHTLTNSLGHVPQFAIHEFQKNVKSSRDSWGIFPSNKMWRSYITLLANHEYVSELSKVMKWWLDIRFEPERKTLMELLAALPFDFAERHITHHEKANSSQDWDWPSMREFERYLSSKNSLNLFNSS
ncbi:uncharacterized protein LODBEIA_P32250 [Lodderomyces beijingensis]|uniref:Uncharacterized protein n=1 Tax=Lodderomyces beijingensis TaxID=1775926 RepID=A0ABP0ZQ00_9ASCO